MAEDRFANIFQAQVTMSAANALTFIQLNFGITIRDNIGIVIDSIYFYPTLGSIAEMTATGDALMYGITLSDSVTEIFDIMDSRVLFNSTFTKHVDGAPAAAMFIHYPFEHHFAPPILQLPQKIYFGLDTVGLANPAVGSIRMHYRTVNISSAEKLIEILETLHLST